MWFVEWVSEEQTFVTAYTNAAQADRRAVELVAEGYEPQVWEPGFPLMATVCRSCGGYVTDEQPAVRHQDGSFPVMSHEQCPTMSPWAESRRHLMTPDTIAANERLWAADRAGA